MEDTTPEVNPEPVEEPIHEGQNTGVIMVMPRPGDFVAGGETGIIPQQINDSGDWTPVFPKGEWQRDMVSGFESDACVSFSANDSLETYANQCINNGLWPNEHVQFLKDNGYIDANGSVNFSDRFTARMSNTTTDGNSLPNVGDSIRAHGLVPESKWPSPFPFQKNSGNSDLNWNSYYKTVDQDVQDIGLTFNKWFKVQYEWVKIMGSFTIEQWQQVLKFSPLQLATAVCWLWNTANQINACGPGSAHATMLGKAETVNGYTILDHYDPFIKHLAPNYDLTYAIRFVIVPIAQSTPTPAPVFQHTFTTTITYGMEGAEVTALQKALQALHRPNGLTYMKAGLFGPFGPQTKAAVDFFQRDHHIVDPQPGQNVGPQTRGALNAALLALKK